MVSMVLLRQPRHWASVLRWATLAGLEMAVIGPFGSYKANIFNRLCYWMALCWLGSLTLWPSIVTALSVGPRRGFPPLFSGASAVLLVSFPLAAAAAAGCYLFWPVHASGIRSVEWYTLTAVVLLPSAAGLIWLELARVPAGAGRDIDVGGRSEDAAVSTSANGRDEAGTLPDHVLAAALCLQMEDHHIRVHTVGGSSLHHGVLRDVVGGIDPGRGLQVHRSWWVARTAVCGWHREDRSVVLSLANGLRVPVARHRLALLRSQGWLSPDQEKHP
jgi:hypothetical protein